MSRDLKDQFRDLAERVMTCFQNTLPSKQFNALLSLSVIWLGVLAERETKTKDPKERRIIEDEFEAGKRAIERGIEMLHEQTRRGSEETFPRTTRTLPRMWRALAADRTLLHLSGLR